jgi:hypothetical protein
VGEMKMEETIGTGTLFIFIRQKEREELEIAVTLENQRN